MVTKGEGGVYKLGLELTHTHTTIYKKIENQQRSTVQHKELYSIL